MNLKSNYSVTECAELLKTSSQQVRNWIKSGKIRAERVGKQFIVSGDDIAYFLEEYGFEIEPDDHACTLPNSDGLNAISFFSGALKCLHHEITRRDVAEIADMDRAGRADSGCADVFFLIRTAGNDLCRHLI